MQGWTPSCPPNPQPTTVRYLTYVKYPLNIQHFPIIHICVIENSEGATKHLPVRYFNFSIQKTSGFFHNTTTPIQRLNC